MRPRTTPRRPARWALALLILCAYLAAAGLATAAAAPTLTLDPAAGPCGTRPVARGAGFPAALPVLIQRGGDNGPTLGRGTAAADGSFAIALDFLCDPAAPPADGAQVTVVASPDASRGAAPGDPPLRVSATYTVRAAEERQYFGETGHWVEGRFLDAWRRFGGLAIVGYPISESFFQVLEDGRERRVQYFERARLEFHGEFAGTDDEVQLGQFGRRILAGVPGAPTAPAAPLGGAMHFAETGHNVRGGFAAYWQRNGGLAVFGYPLSEEFEQRLEDGRVYTVQYFERARFEHHPENAAPYDVLLGHFGRRILAETATP